MKKVYGLITIVLFITTFYFFGFIAKMADIKTNKVTMNDPLRNHERKGDLIPFMADLHCDALIWNRDLLEESIYGHVDLPRIQKANMALQFFSIATKVPRGVNIESNPADTDMIGLLSFFQLLPPKTWFSAKERALNQCRMMHKYVVESGGQLVFIDSRARLADFVTSRANGGKAVACMLGIEGAHVLENDLNNVKRFADLGVRYIGLTHYFDNEWAGSAHGEKKGGLTEMGKKLIREMEKYHITIDLSHASEQTIDDVLALTDAPVIMSHTGVRGVCNNNRNLSDKHLDEIGRRGGLVGIGLWETAVCGKNARATAINIKYAADRIGVDKVALGSDFDGAIETHFDVTGLPLLVTELQKMHYSQEDINKIMGGNVRDYFMKHLPD